MQNPDHKEDDLEHLKVCFNCWLSAQVKTWKEQNPGHNCLEVSYALVWEFFRVTGDHLLHQYRESGHPLPAEEILDLMVLGALSNVGNELMRSTNILRDSFRQAAEAFERMSPEPQSEEQKTRPETKKPEALQTGDAVMDFLRRAKAQGRS